MIKILTLLTLTSNYIVINNDNPYWYVDNPIIDTYNNQFLSAENLVDILIHNQLLENIDYLYAVYLDDIYENNYTIVGLYQVKVKITTINESPTLNASINVISPLKEEKKLSWYDYVYLFFKKLIEKIKKFFS